MKGNLTRIGIISLVLTLCLAGVGIVYGHWTGTLDIEGTVQTGELDMEFLHCNVTEINDPLEIGETKVVCVDTDSDGDSDAMLVNMSNVTASYRAEIAFDVNNNGTLPLVINSIQIDVDQTSLGSDAFDIQLDGIAPGDSINPGDSKSCVLRIHVLTEEIGCYGFFIIIEAVNWNEGGGP